MVRQITPDALSLLETDESLRLVSYDDATGKPIFAGQLPKGVISIGYGHTGNVTAGETETQDQAVSDLKNDLSFVERFVDSHVTVNLNENQFSALVLFSYNCGIGNFSRYILPYINSSDFAGYQAKASQFVKSGGVVMDGLVRRRQEEIDLFNKPVPA